MAIIRLKNTGSFVEGDTQETESFFERPVMLVYVGKFESMDGPVEVKPDHISKLVANHNNNLSKVKLNAKGEVPPRHNPPLQLDHSASATMTVGRLVGPLSEGTFEDDDGKTKPAVFGRARFLGKENVEKAKDGRWEHVSIGADLELGKLNELSITPFPAAPNASMLSKGALTMDPKDKEKFKKHLKECKKMSDKDADDHLAKCEGDEEAHKKLAAECDEHEKKMAAEAEEDKAKLAKKLSEEAEEKEKKEKEEKEKGETKAKKLTAAREGFARLTTDFRKQADDTRMTARVANLSARLSTFRASAKISPAEIKKINLTEWAGKPDAEVDAFLKGLELREPVLPIGQFGTTKAVSMSKLAGQAKNSQLSEETLANMPFLSKVRGNKESLAGDKKASGRKEFSSETVDKNHEEHMAAFMSEHKKLLSEGKHDEAEEKLRSHLMQAHGLAALGEGHPMPMDKDHEKQMSGLVSSIEKLQNQFQELVTLVGPVLEG